MSTMQKTQASSALAYTEKTSRMLSLLCSAGFQSFGEHGRWEACLCALALKLDPRCNVYQILDALPYQYRELDENTFLNAMAHMGYYGRTMQGRPQDVDSRILPALYVSEKNEPLILIAKKLDGGVVIYDPQTKALKTGRKSDFKKGHLWFFQPYDLNRVPTSKFMRSGSGHSWFRALLYRFKPNFLQIMIAGFIINLLALAIPLFIMLVYDRIIALGTLDPLPILTLGAFAAVALEYKLRNVRSRGLSWLSGRLDHIVSNKIFSHLIGLPPALIERASVAAQVARIKTFESVRDFFSGSACLSVLEAPFVVIAIAAIGFVAGPLIWVPVIVIGLYLLIFAFVRQQVKTAIRLAAKCSSARQQFTIESFEKLHDIRACGLTQHWQEKFRHLSGREIMSHFKLGWLGMMAETSANSLTVLSAVATIGFGVHMIWAGTLSTGGLVAVMILVWRILTPFYSLCTMIPRLEQLRNSIIQVNNLMDIDAEEETAKSHARLIQITGRLRFADVTFRYDADADPVLERLSFQLGAGEMLGLSGENGSGKSSVLKLIKSLYKPEGGAIFIDGFDVRQLDAPHLRRQIAYVPKNPKSFRGTILENMRLSNPTASAKDIEKALRLADVWDDVQKLPNGLETVIGKHNRLNLSSGMETRLALARAYLHPGKILMIDSLPNALLSGPAGHNLKTYLSRIRGIRTVIMVSYRDDFLKMADQVLILRSHSQAVSGSYDQVTQQLNSKQQSVAV